MRRFANTQNGKGGAVPGVPGWVNVTSCQSVKSDGINCPRPVVVAVQPLLSVTYSPTSIFQSVLEMNFCPLGEYVSDVQPELKVMSGSTNMPLAGSFVPALVTVTVGIRLAFPTESE